MKRWLCFPLFAALACSLSPTAAAGGIGSGALASNFTLGVATPPEVITSAATNLTFNSARLNGSSNPLGLISQGWFEWGLAPPPPAGDSTSKQALGLGGAPVPYNATITGLLPSTTYHYRAASENGNGRTYGDVVSFTTAPFTRDSAISRVMAQIIDPSPYKNSLIAFIYDPPGADSTLDPGTTVAPLDSEFVRTLPAKTWMFWIDLTGDVRFAHPCKFVYVDANTGAVTSDDGLWWPAVTAPGDTTVYPWKSIDERGSDSTSRIYGDYIGVDEPFSMSPSMGSRNIITGENGIMLIRPRGVLAGNTCAILVGGGALSKGEENAWQSDLDSMSAMLSSPPPGGGAPMAGEVQAKNNATEADLKAMIDSAVAHGCNSIIFYYSGHGGKKNGGYLYLKDVNLSYCDLAALLNQGASLKFKDVILDNCYGGISVPCFDGKAVPVTIFTAADSTKTSSGTVWYRDKNGNGVFDNSDSIKSGKGKYTGALMACWRKLRDSLNINPTMKQVHDWVLLVNPDSIKEKQNPQYKKFIPPASITHNINSTGHYDFLGTGVFIDFFNIDGPFNVTVTRIFEPPSGSIAPGDLELGTLSTFDFWNIEAFPPSTFIAAVGFEFDSTNEQIPPSKLRIGTRPTPSGGNPNPPWTNYAPTNFNPGPGGGLMLCQNVNHFSEWTFSETLEQITSVDVPVSDKWNMISLPMNVPDASAGALYPTATPPAYYFSAGYLPTDTLDHCRGYWMKFVGGTTVSISGSQVLRDTCPVASGWNMIGSVTKPLAVGEVTTIPPGVVLSGFFGYDGGYALTDSIRPGQGYWVKAGADAQLVFDVFPAASPRVQAFDLSGLNSLEIRDASGSAQTLYFGAEAGSERASFAEMPPVPPPGAFDARFSSGLWIEQYASRSGLSHEYAVNISSASYPVTLSWNLTEGATRRFALDGIRPISGSGSLQLSGPTPVVIRVEDADLPQEFRLAQNYPNPFNPTARIRYELPSDVHVTLAVYNTLGMEVANLIDAPKAAGRYEVDVDASGWASGVYFYRLRAGTFTDVKKMILIR